MAVCHKDILNLIIIFYFTVLFLSESYYKKALRLFIDFVVVKLARY